MKLRWLSYLVGQCTALNFRRSMAYKVDGIVSVRSGVASSILQTASNESALLYRETRGALFANAVVSSASLFSGSTSYPAP